MLLDPKHFNSVREYLYRFEGHMAVESIFKNQDLKDIADLFFGLLGVELTETRARNIHRNFLSLLGKDEIIDAIYITEEKGLTCVGDIIKYFFGVMYGKKRNKEGNHA